MYIYKITNLVNNMVYIGQTINARPIERWYVHRSRLRCGKHNNIHLQSSYNDNGENSFKFEVIEKTETRSFLNQREIHWIKFYSSTLRTHGYNLDSGGHTEKEVSQETRDRLSQAGLNRKLSDESKRRLSESRRGIVFSDDHLKKLSTSHLGQIAWNKKNVLCIETGEIFPSATAAAKAIGTSQGNVSAVCRGEKKSILSFTFRYL